MPLYPFDCDPCSVSWEVEGKMANPPKKRRCPQCDKMRDRVFKPTNVIFKGAGWDTNISRQVKYNKEGMDKDTANEFLNNAIASSKKNQQTGGQHYKNLKYNANKALKEGKVRKVDNKQKADTQQKSGDNFVDHHRKKIGQKK